MRRRRYSSKPIVESLSFVRQALVTTVLALRHMGVRDVARIENFIYRVEGTVRLLTVLIESGRMSESEVTLIARQTARVRSEIREFRDSPRMVHARLEDVYDLFKPIERVVAEWSSISRRPISRKLSKRGDLGRLGRRVGPRYRAILSERSNLDGAGHSEPPPREPAAVSRAESMRPRSVKHTSAKKPRFANATLMRSDSTRQALDTNAALKAGTRYLLRIDIGKLSKTTQVVNPQELPEHLIPKDVHLEVVVSSSDFQLTEVSDKVGSSSVVSGKLFLPADGGAATTPEGGRYLCFYLTAPAVRMTAYCRIGFYYLDVLVQSQQLKANVGKRGGFEFVVDYTLSNDFQGLSNVPGRNRISVLTNANGQGSHQFVLRSRGGSPNSSEAKTFAVLGEKIQPILKQLRTVLGERVATSVARSASEFKRDLQEIAPIGWRLFQLLPAQSLDTFAELAKKPSDTVLQVSRPSTSDLVLPWAIMYDIPLTSNELSYCPLLDELSDGTKVLDASVRDCPHGPHEENVLCPLGFWGFKYSIEQLSSSDSPVYEIEVTDDCRVVAAKTQFGINVKELADHLRSLQAELVKTFPRAKLVEADDKSQTRSGLGEDLPLVYFFCHGQRSSDADPNVALAIGKREPLPASEFIGWVRTWQIRKKRVWDKVRPLIFINACHSLAIYPNTMTSYLDAFVGTARAAGVIGTEVKVPQGLASKVAERFFALLFEGKSVDEALFLIRREYLAWGNLFGLMYSNYCAADLRLVKK